VLLLLLLACGDASTDSAAPLGEDSSEPSDCADAPGVTWESWGEGFFTTWCQACHTVTTVERNGAPPGVDFDTEADVVFWSASVRQAVLEAGTMPVGGGLSKDDTVLLETLLDCGL
jgi:cytochrome c5